MNEYFKKFSMIIMPALIAGISACGAPAQTTAATAAAATTTAVETTTTTETAPAQPDPSEGYDLYADLTGGFDSVSDKFEFSDGWTNGSMFNCTWRKKNGSFDENGMQLKIDIDSAGAKIPYSGAEFRTKGFYGYGLYEVTMKPIKNDGVVSSFFTYTGPSDQNPWDEIDIEFLGKDTTVVQFNYFTDGKGGHEYIHELGFDASQEYHTYGFEWLADSITWYVDGEAVHTATKKIPSTPGKLMMNVWPGTGVDGWLKAFDGNVPLTAEYSCIKFTEAK